MRTLRNTIIVIVALLLPALVYAQDSDDEGQESTLVNRLTRVQTDTSLTYLQMVHACDSLFAALDGEDTTEGGMYSEYKRCSAAVGLMTNGIRIL